MTATALVGLSRTVSTCNNNQEGDVEAYEESDSSRSCESDEETDKAIVVANDTAPTIESVSVVNSNQVHIGNKTVYKGPVVIKQIVCSNAKEKLDSALPGLDKEKNEVIDTLSSVVSGIDNPAFVKDGPVRNCDIDADRNDNDTANSTGIEKGFLRLKNCPKNHSGNLVIFFSLLILAITILTVILYWKRPATVENASYGDTDEQENNTPVDYTSESNGTINERLRLIPRLQWLAQPAVHPVDALNTPVSLVIVHHTATESCISTAQCVYHVRHIQQFHIESNQWWDIGYNFLVGGDGCAYVGRGWKSEGAHTLGYNHKSVGVAFIGTFTSEPPPKNQIAVFFKLLEKGVQLGYLTEDYKILGAKQLQGTESPGSDFMKVIQTWKHWAKQP